MYLPKNFSDLKQMVSEFNGWQRIWLVLSAIVFCFAFFVWVDVISNPFSGFKESSRFKRNLTSLEQTLKDNEVDCALNKKYAEEDFNTAFTKSQEIDAKIQKLNDENYLLRHSIYSYLTENQRKIINNDRQISELKSVQKGLFNSPTLAKQKACKDMAEAVSGARFAYDSAQSKEFDPLIAFLKSTFLILLFYIIFVGFLYLAGYSLGWIYRGFKK